MGPHHQWVTGMAPDPLGLGVPVTQGGNPLLEDTAPRYASMPALQPGSQTLFGGDLVGIVWDSATQRYGLIIRSLHGYCRVSYMEAWQLRDNEVMNAVVVRAAQRLRGRNHHHTPERRDTMLELLLKLYTAAMSTGTTGLLPHFVGPPGSGKSTTFEQLAELLGVKLHIINVSRINPLGLEGLEMPDAEGTALRLLHSEMWTKANEGDIYLFDEFLRGFPEVYNGLLDIFTSRQVAGHKLPPVFIAAASNSVATYDPALEDRLLHIPVPDPRSDKHVAEALQTMLIDRLGLLPELKGTYEMEALLTHEVFPTYEMLDTYKKGGGGRQVTATAFEGSSLRKLISSVQLRHVQSTRLKELIARNNQDAMRTARAQYVVLLSGKNPPVGYETQARGIQGSPKLTPLQSINLQLNLDLIDMERAKAGGTTTRERTLEDDILDELDDD